MAWRREVPTDMAALRALAVEVRRAFPKLDTKRDLEWVAVEQGWPASELLILVDRCGDDVVGFVVLNITSARLEYLLGGLTLSRTSVRQFNLYQGIALAGDDQTASIDDCLRVLRQFVRPGDVVHFGAVPVGSELHGHMAARSNGWDRNFYVLPWGDEKQHCRINWTGSFEAYLSSLGKVTRKDLRRSSRALLNDTSLKCEVRCFRTPDEADAFLRDGIPVSDRTYQKRDLGLGLARGGGVERSIRFAASVGAFLGYVLCVDDVPVAFEYGFVWAGVCVMQQAGYDPAWADRQVGSVLFTEFLHDLEKSGTPIKQLDLLPGVNLFKLRTTNEKFEIQHYNLFPRSYVGAARFSMLAAADWVSRRARRLVGRRSDDVEQYRARRGPGSSRIEPADKS